MMTKAQPAESSSNNQAGKKIWMWIFMAMFIIPEILWSPVLNFLYTFWKGGNIPVIFRNNLLISSDYRWLAILVIFVQCIGLLLSLVSVLKIRIKIFAKIILFLLFLILFILSLLVFIFLFATINMRIF